MGSPTRLRSSVALQRGLGDDRGATAIEFALVAPLFFLLILGILEIALVVWFGNMLHDGAHQAGRYLRDESVKCFRRGDDPLLGVYVSSQGQTNCTAATMAGIRSAACAAISKGGMSCDAAKLKVAVYSADDPVANPIPAPTLVDDASTNLKKSRAYVIALGYEWGISLPTTRLLLTSQGKRVQLKSRIYVSTAERALR